MEVITATAADGTGHGERGERRCPVWPRLARGATRRARPRSGASWPAWPTGARPGRWRASLLVGCSLGRGAADALSDIDAALGVDAPRGEAGAERVETVEAMVVAALPELGPLVDVLRHRTGPAGQHVRRIFAQFTNGTQLDLVVVAAAEIDNVSAHGGAPDFIPLYGARHCGATGPGDRAARRRVRRGAAGRVRGHRRAVRDRPSTAGAR